MCIFCKIANKEISAKIIFEDDDVMAILDISSATKGHSLVIPKQHYTNLLELPKDLSHKMMDVSVSVAKDVTTKLAASGCNILSNINEEAGQTVFHAHIHILPRYSDDDLTIKFTPHKADLDDILKQILND